MAFFARFDGKLNEAFEGVSHSLSCRYLFLADAYIVRVMYMEEIRNREGPLFNYFLRCKPPSTIF